jgi:hypothetical protein
MGTPEECRAFFDKFDPEASAVSDPDAFFYDAFGLHQASASSFLAPGVFTAGLRAVMKGNLVGKPVGEVKQMPGEFLVHDAAIVWKHIAEHIGDHPDLREVARRARELEAQRE